MYHEYHTRTGLPRRAQKGATGERLGGPTLEGQHPASPRMLQRLGGTLVLDAQIGAIDVHGETRGPQRGARVARAERDLSRHV